MRVAILETILMPAGHEVEFDRILHAKKPVFVNGGDKLQDIFDKGTGAEMPTDFANNYYKELDCFPLERGGLE